MKKAGIIILVIGLAFLALEAFAWIFFGFGFVMFAVLGEMRYFARYVALDGYYPIVNLLFLFDYLMMLIGGFGIPVAITGGILTAIGASTGKKKESVGAAE